ncbi:ATP-grasp enzyme-like protein [Cupriavidus necator N-1]|jgi:predicted ATP-grasp superfamily ATP-dependent carboligase|uniref:ATP-grasp enzyme-like protein n=1 Tax=Cupriavidus necator (strain ATCC 43291 / DSM 13513 / CCUG 52238 / LMG 8453 / N-1) TaxID=1042878 RepID=F8GMV8_CUPNN|nr:ATP-grasp enzyme-like protein [Cupriavidus necator N-1]
MMKSTLDPAETTAAVVVGGELGGLGLVRSLAGKGIPVLLADTGHTTPASWSRHARRHIIRSLVGREFTEDLIALARRLGQRPVLFLTDEDAVHSVSENRDELSEWFRFCVPPAQGVRMLSSKSAFHCFAEENGFPVPRTVIMNGQLDVPLLSGLRYPAVIKPDDKRQALTGDKERAIRVQSLAEGQAHARAMLRTPGGIVAQEWIEGPQSNIHFTLFYRGMDGKAAAVFTGRKLACWPPEIGSTAVCVAAPEASEELEPITLAFAERASFYGMGSMEYKWDEIHRRFVMIEPTVGRIDWQEEIATLCGVNIPLAAYRHELGLPDLPAATPPPGGAVWRATFLRSAPRSLMPHGARIFDGYFRWDDPLPAIQHYCLSMPLDRFLLHWSGWFPSTRRDQVQQEQQ